MSTIFKVHVSGHDDLDSYKRAGATRYPSFRFPEDRDFNADALVHVHTKAFRFPFFLNVCVRGFHDKFGYSIDAFI